MSNDRTIADIEIISPGNKSTPGAIRTFVEKASQMLRGGIHLLVIDPFPPTPRDPQGIAKLIWDELDISDFVLPKDRPLTVASFMGGASQEAFIEPVSVGSPLPEMPLFLTTDIYVPLPLETTYQSAWEAVPRAGNGRWRMEERAGINSDQHQNASKPHGFLIRRIQYGRTATGNRTTRNPQRAGNS